MNLRVSPNKTINKRSVRFNSNATNKLEIDVINGILFTFALFYLFIAKYNRMKLFLLSYILEINILFPQLKCKF